MWILFVACLLRGLVIFDEPGFPAVDVSSPLPSIAEAARATSVAELERALGEPGTVLVWRHGSAYPAEAWGAIVRFLEGGGSMLVLGGEPFTRPVTGEVGGRVVGPRSISCLKELRLNRCERVDVEGATLRWLGEEPVGNWGRPPERVVSAAAEGEGGAWAAVLEPRFTDAKDYPDEDGSPGPRDAILRPLAHLTPPGADTRFPTAAAAVEIDRLRGRFAGGRWVLWLASAPPTSHEMRRLVEEAKRPPVDFRVDPVFACFHEGETPKVVVRLHRPRAHSPEIVTPTMLLTEPDGRALFATAHTVEFAEYGEVEVELEVSGAPGLYRISAGLEGAHDFETGFWIHDPELFASGDALTFDRTTLRRDGAPEPVVGTTVMSRSVHRNFLFEPNPAEWDDTFAELASIGVNLVRTGVWSGWRKIVPEPDTVDEAWLRALEAYYLTARRHGIPVLFTFFAFVPEGFGGENPYLDPSAVEAQAAWLGAVAERFRGAKEILWDLINEPSFASPEKLWRCRPNGDRFEREAFLAWLAHDFGDDWEREVRERWRLLPDEAIGLPSDDDFEDRHVFGDVRPYRAMDWVRFAQDAFEGWARRMTHAIREGGSTGAITVGQDEGGLVQRPNPLFHARALDFTSMHTWWWNDALLFDGVMAKATGRPMLVSETGIMQRELLSGEALRDADERARLLARKIGYAFAAGAFGAIQWCYDVNPYMASDNEVAIGLRRVDGSYKPEHRVLREFAEFVARNRARFDSPAEPEVVLLVPAGDLFAPRGEVTALGATRRAVEILVAELGVPVRAVAEYRTAEDLGSPCAIVLPACRGISEGAWRDLRAAVERGATLLCSGWFEADDAGIAAERLGALAGTAVSSRPLASRALASRALALVEFPGGCAIAGAPCLRYPLDVVQSWPCAAEPSPAPIALGKGKIVPFALPIEWAERSGLQTSLYESRLRDAGIESVPAGPAGVLVRRVRFRGATLVVVVNDSSAPFALPEPSLVVGAGEARMAFLDREGNLLDATGRVP